MEYCECKEGNAVDLTKSYDGWTPFLEQENVLVWRKPHEKYPNQFAYKGVSFVELVDNFFSYFVFYDMRSFMICSALKCMIVIFKKLFYTNMVLYRNIEI